MKTLFVLLIVLVLVLIIVNLCVYNMMKKLLCIYYEANEQQTKELHACITSAAKHNFDCTKNYADIIRKEMKDYNEATMNAVAKISTKTTTKKKTNKVD